MAMDLDMEVDEDMQLDVVAVQEPAVSRKGKGRQLYDGKRTATLHRIRFLDYMPSSILAIALTPQTYDPSVHHPYLPSLHSGNGREILAVGRQNGEIEIYTWIGGEGVPSSSSKNKNKQDKRRGSISAPLTGAGKQGWVLERRLAPPSPSRVEHLLFTHQTILSEDDYNLCEDEREFRKEIDDLRKSKPRLFTSGGGSDLWEWEWTNSKEGGMGYVKKSLPSQGGAIWSIAVNPSNTTLALGCDDGAVRLVNLWDGALEMLRKFDTTKTRLLSVAWGPQQKQKSNKGKQKQIEGTNQLPGLTQYHDSYIVTGCADSTVRKWDVKTGRCTSRMTTDKLKGEHTLVWSVAVIAASSSNISKAGGGTVDSDVIVSGDSMGLVKFWDEKTNTQTESLKCHKRDILCLTIGPDGKSVYSSGVDQVISEVQLTTVKVGGNTRSGKQNEVGKWIHTHSRRLHAHDVRAITISPSYSSLFPSKFSYSHNIETNRVPIVISGGYDFSLVYTPAATTSTAPNLPNPISESQGVTFTTSNQRKASYIPQRDSSLVTLAHDAGLMAERSLQSINLWALRAVNEVARGQKAPAKGQEYQKVLEMELNTQTNLISSAISDDGKWLAASDSYEVRLWRLKFNPDGSIRPRRIASITTALASHSALKDYEHHAASHLHFTNDSSKLILGSIPGSHVAVLQLPESKHGEVSILRVFSQHRSRNAYSRALAGRTGTAGDDEEESASDSEEDESDEIVPSLACMTTSNDGQWLITGDMTGRLHVFNLDSLQYHAALPSVEVPPVDMAFSPSNASIVVVALPNNTIQVFDVDQRTIPTWAQHISRNSFATFTNLREPILGVTFDPVPETGRHTDTLVIYGANYIGTMKLSLSEQLDNSLSSMTIEKRKRDGETITNGMTRQGENNKEESSDEDDDDEGEGEDTDGEAINTSLNKGRSTMEVTYKYQPVLFCDFTNQGDMVVVEKPYFSMLSQMAPAFSAKKYGHT